MRFRVRFALVALAALLIALPASAGAAEVPTVGERINLFDPPTTFDAGVAFHVSHGWGAAGLESTRVSTIPDYSFELFVDGVRAHGPKSITIEDGEWQEIVWTFSFPKGLDAGTHEFRGVWSGPTFEIEHTIEFGG